MGRPSRAEPLKPSQTFSGWRLLVSISASESTLCLTMVQIPQKRRRLEETMGATLEGEGEDTAPPGEEGSHQEGATLEGEGEDTAPPGEEGSHQEMQKLASEMKVGQKRKRPNIKLEPGTVSGTVNVPVPVRYLSRVKHYINTLELLEICRQVHPSILSFPEEEHYH
ncbi:uncharacterized protein [Cherax quadricarinatus]